MTESVDRHLLVPVAESVTMRNTVAYAADLAADAATDDAPATLHLVVVESARVVDPDGPAEMAEASELLDRAALWAEEDLGGGEDGPTVEVQTAVVGATEYLFSPDQYADAIADYASANDVDRIVLDPEYDPGTTAPMLWSLATELARRPVPVEEAPVDRPRRGTVLAGRGTVWKYGVVFAAAYGFYLALGSLSLFDLATGAVTAAVVSALLAPIAFGSEPSPRRLAAQMVRMSIYAPYLLWEIAKANLQIAYVVLHPSLPIDPKMVSFSAAVWGDVPVTTLANSITLTPGTLSVAVSERAFTVHSLTAGAREDLFEGSLERAVRFVFLGREAAQIPSPVERGSRIDRRFPGGDVAGEPGGGSVLAESGSGGSPEPSAENADADGPRDGDPRLGADAAPDRDADAAPDGEAAREGEGSRDE